MANNPYETPAPVAKPGVVNYEYRSAASLVRTLSSLLVTLAILNVTVVALSILGEVIEPTAEVDAESLESTAFLAVLGATGCVLMVFILCYLATVVLFCIWVNRANKNARALGAIALSTTPGWAVGWFFIPIANLFKPYQAVKEIAQSSNRLADPHRWRMHPLPGFFSWWWGTWIVGNLLGRAETRLALSDEVAMMQAGVVVGVIAGLAQAAAALLAMRVVRHIHDKQEDKCKHIPAAGTAAVHDFA